MGKWNNSPAGIQGKQMGMGVGEGRLRIRSVPRGRIINPGKG